MLFDTELERDGFQQRSVVRHQGQAQSRTTDRVVEEMPVALVFNGVSQAVMMATPRDLEDFALGFSLSEGLIGRADELLAIEPRFLLEGIYYPEMSRPARQPAQAQEANFFTFLKAPVRLLTMAGQWFFLH